MTFSQVGLLVMMWPILCRISFSSLRLVFRDRRIWHHLAFVRFLSSAQDTADVEQSVIVNWIIAPLVMLALAWAFLPDREDLRQGLILVGLARCIAMVRQSRSIGDPYSSTGLRSSSGPTSPAAIRRASLLRYNRSLN